MHTWLREMEKRERILVPLLAVMNSTVQIDGVLCVFIFLHFY